MTLDVEVQNNGPWCKTEDKWGFGALRGIVHRHKDTLSPSPLRDTGVRRTLDTRVSYDGNVRDRSSPRTTTKIEVTNESIVHSWQSRDSRQKIFSTLVGV